MIKKIMLLASMALTATAMVAPAAQAEWLHNGAPLKANATITLSGPFIIHAPFNLGTFTCTLHATMTASPGSTANVTKFEPTTTTCVGTNFYQGCKLKTHTSTVPMLAHANTAANTISITNVTINHTYEGAGCQATSMHASFSVTATPDNPASISSVKVSGTSGLGATVSGTLNVTPAKTYGIA